jgi:dephospho-CoA kinase
VLKIGLTGGIASGKSTVAAMFAELGAGIIDTDEISRQLTGPGGECIDAIEDAFGSEYLTSDRALDRRRMRQLIFTSDEDRRRLEAILHPKIRAKAIADTRASKDPYVILAVPLLFETGFDALTDRALVVDCPEKIQIGRLIERDGIEEQEARAIISAQLDRAERLRRADDVIDTSEDLASTRNRVLALHQQYLGMSENCPPTQGRAE